MQGQFFQGLTMCTGMIILSTKKAMVPVPGEERSTMNNAGPSQQINVELGEKEAEGIYSNFVLISHSPAEFVLDFTRMLPGVPKTKVYARIIMTPQHAKSLSKALNENIEKFEKEFGEIIVVKGDEPKQFGFKSGSKQTSTSQTKP